MSYDEIYSKLKNVGQEQLLDFYDELNDEEKENLLKQIEKIDFSILDLINHQNEERCYYTVKGWLVRCRY